MKHQVTLLDPVTFYPSRFHPPKEPERVWGGPLQSQELQAVFLLLQTFWNRDYQVMHRHQEMMQWLRFPSSQRGFSMLQLHKSWRD
jgi:hypothetical protein